MHKTPNSTTSPQANSNQNAEAMPPHVREQHRTTRKLMPYASDIPTQRDARSHGPTTYTKYMVPKPITPCNTGTTVSSPRPSPPGSWTVDAVHT
jgi:hypothetical protein